ncbi:MAG: citrate/2-methylcitrate synthase, partial [Thermodesulfobacteriota bacterium]
MESVLKKVEKLALQHDRIDPELVREKNIKLGLRNADGTGVVAGITSKGQVKGYEKIDDGSGNYRVVPAHGVLCYCGYDVSELVVHVEEEGRCGFDETAFLLLTGELPSRSDLKQFSKALAKRRVLPEKAWRIITEKAENDDHMGALHTAISALHKFDPNPNSTELSDVTRQCVDLVAKFPTVVA